MSKSNLLILLCLFLLATPSITQTVEGYYRYPDVHDDVLVFSAEGDIWKVSVNGGLAQRLTTHAEEERYAHISPDGTTIAFSASYEGPTEVYTMPITGGLPTRWTYESDVSIVNGWTPEGHVLYDTRAYSTLPNRQLISIDLSTSEKVPIPLSQASEGSFDNDGNTVFFVRPSYHGNVTKRYKGGTARQIWKFAEGSSEAVKLTTDYAGESHHPMWHNGRVYFITDRDGTMNIWSMDENGQDRQQHTSHAGFDVRYANLSAGTIVYQIGADIWKYDIESDDANKIEIQLASDLDQLREKWETNPSRYITSVNPSFEGDKVVITARGRVFVSPVKSGRHVEFTAKSNVRYRDAIFSSDGKSIYTLSDESGEFEFVSLPSDGVGDGNPITSNGNILRYAGIPSPDGQWIAYDDLASNMYVLDISTGLSTKISTNDEGIYTFSWSPDSKWVAFVQVAKNTMAQIHAYNVETQEHITLTTDRANSRYPKWSPDGEFLYFLSDRSFTTLVGSPWGPRQPEPYFDASEKLYVLPLQKEGRSPFRPHNELLDTDSENGDNGPDFSDSVVIHKEGILQRIEEVPIKPGNFRSLAVNDKAIYLIATSTGVNASNRLAYVTIDNEDVKLKTMVDGASGFQLTGDGKKMLVAKSGSFYMIKAGTSQVNSLSDHKINMNGWKIWINPREDWKQIFTDAWRMERDYFYDKNMHGVNWDAMHDKYLPLVDRVTTRDELSDLIGRFVGELSALHTSVRGGDLRSDPKNISVASLGARFSRDESSNGFRIDHIYKADPDYPDEKSPLDDPLNDIAEGDIITHIDGRPCSQAKDIGELIRNKAGKQVRISVMRASEKREFIVVPLSNSYRLRYRDWEYSRRMKVEEDSNDQIGYVHLQAMGSRDLNQWYREFYPVFDRPGLIVDVRHNRGGNIESFILEKLMRKAWMYWKSRSGDPYWNMQYAFRGHVVVLVNENTASDGEAFADGFRRLGLGTTIGTRTWGGEIWLSSSNRLTDGGLARAPMMGVYGPEGEWLIEGHGFDPDIVVDNLPHATYNGEDAQLDAAIEFLEELIQEDPREVPPVPPYPDKSFDNKR